MYAWFLPPLGVFTGVSSVKFASYDVNQQTKFRILGIIGITLSLINAVTGILIHFKG